MTRAVVIGKFYPPHKGHHLLIDTALRQADEVAVIVCDRRGEQSIPGELRARWLREVHPGASVVVVEDTLPPDDSRAWAELTLKTLGYRPDLVFTSEEYGERYASFLGARHVPVDPDRRTVPVSGTKIREYPLRHWEFLAPCVRAHYARRVCVVGAESTGTTTMARALAEHFGTAWVPEFGRTYGEARMASPEAAAWRTDEFVFIAQEQNRIEDALARICNKLLVCDTDSFATELWHERYMGFLSPEVAAQSRGREPALHLLTDADIPFVQDGTRDGEAIRLSMHRRFEEELRRRGKPFLLLSGPHEARLEKAVAACEGILCGNDPVGI